MSSQNGTVAKGAATQNNSTNNAKVVPITKAETLPAKVEMPKAETPKAELPPPTQLEKQRERMDVLTVLFEKEERLTSTHNSLKSFLITLEDEGNQLELKDGKGRRFNTGNPSVIAEVLAVAKKTVEARLAEVQAKIVSI